MKKTARLLDPSGTTYLSLSLLASIDGQWEKYMKALADSREELSFEAVRELCIAARRMRVMLQLMERLHEDKRLRKAERRFKAQSDKLDELRDTQVMLVEVEGELPQLPGLKDFRACLQEREKKLGKAIRTGLKKVKTGKNLRVIVDWIEDLEAEEAKRLPEKTLAALDEAFQEAERRYEKMDPAEPATIHRLRVGFRKFRYMAEAAEGLIPGYPPEMPENMKEYQHRMGKVQDFRVLLESLADFGAHEPDFDAVKPQEYFRHCLEEATCEFLDGQAELDTFWRARRDLPFPWEKNE